MKNKTIAVVTALMLLIAPFILLFSYTKSYKKSKVDTLIPVGAIAVIVLVGIEVLRKILILMPEKIIKFLEGIQV